jgi:DnaK suppressor protein
MPRSLEEVIRAEQDATIDRIRALTADIREITNESTTANVDDEHDPEGSTLAYERAQVSSLLAQATRYLEELDEALVRCEREGSPACARCAVRISMERLVALPATRLCAGCAASEKSVSETLHRKVQRHPPGI